MTNQNFGNPKPRLLRYLNNKSIVNSLGFPSEGLNTIKNKFSNLEIEKNRIFASISGLNIDDIYRCFNELSPLVVGIELNISSPNTQGLKNFHNLKNLQKLLKILNNKKTKPLIVKLPPCLEQENDLIEMVKCVQDSGSEGVVISNSHPIKDSKLNIGFGGLSGKPVYEHTLKMVSKIRKIVDNNFTIIGSGGVSTTSDVWKLIASGANAVQIYSGVVYEGRFKFGQKKLTNPKPTMGPIKTLVSEYIKVSLSENTLRCESATPKDIKTKNIAEYPIKKVAFSKNLGEGIS